MLMNIPDYSDFIAQLLLGKHRSTRFRKSNDWRTAVLKLHSEGHIQCPSFWITQLNEQSSSMFPDECTYSHQSLFLEQFVYPSILDGLTPLPRDIVEAHANSHL